MRKKKHKISRLPASVRKLLAPASKHEAPLIDNIDDSFKWALGIDAGLNTGLLTWDLSLDCMCGWMLTDFWGAYDFVTGFDSYEILVVIEDPNEIPPVWNKVGSVNKKTQEKIAQDVGKNKREASLLVNRFEKLGYQVLTVSPQKLGHKWTYGEFVKNVHLQRDDWLRDLKPQKYKHVYDAGRVLTSQLKYIKPSK